MGAVLWACNAEGTKPLVVPTDGSSPIIGEDAGFFTPTDASSSKDGAKDGAADVVIPPLCGTTFQTSTSTVVTGVKSPFSLSDDELVVAWAEGTVPNVTIHIAERAKRSDAFAEVDVLDSSDGAFALDRPVLEARGFDIAMIDKDRQAWHLFSRQTRGSQFARSAKNIFQELVVFANALGPNELLHDPVWTAAGRSLMFGVATKGIYISDAILGGDDFQAPVALSARAELKPVGANRKRPSGLSSDRLSLFFFDEVTNKSVFATRTDASGDFTTFTAIGDISDAKVGLGCKTLYYYDGAAVRFATQQ